MSASARFVSSPETEHFVAAVRREVTLRPGTILATPTGSLRLLVLVGDADPHSVECDGMVLGYGSPTPCSWSGESDFRAVALVRGGRYRDAETGIELRCLVPGGRNLTVDGRAMRLCKPGAAEAWRRASIA